MALKAECNVPPLNIPRRVNHREQEKSAAERSRFGSLFVRVYDLLRIKRATAAGAVISHPAVSKLSKAKSNELMSF